MNTALPARNPKKIHLSKSAELVLDRDQNANKRNNDFLQSGDALIAAVRTLMYGYVLVSCADEVAKTWCGLDSALSHVSELGNYVRLNTRGNLFLHQKTLDAELAVRVEWARVQQKEPKFTLSEIIETVSKRHTIWPVIGDFRNRYNDKHGGGKGRGPNTVIPQ